MLTLYYSLVYPYLTYCNILWASTYPSHLHKLYLIQKRFVRTATYSKSRNPSSPLFAKLKILPIFDINILQTCSFIFKVKYQGYNLPAHFQQYFYKNSMIHSYATRQAEQLHRPRGQTTRGQFSIKYRGVKLWNDYAHLAGSSPSLYYF